MTSWNSADQNRRVQRPSKARWIRVSGSSSWWIYTDGRTGWKTRWSLFVFMIDLIVMDKSGLDHFGNVVINCGDGKIPDQETVRNMITGKATALKSKFRLTFSMILNLLRVEELRVEVGRFYLDWLSIDHLCRTWSNGHFASSTHRKTNYKTKQKYHKVVSWCSSKDRSICDVFFGLRWKGALRGSPNRLHIWRSSSHRAILWFVRRARCVSALSNPLSNNCSIFNRIEIVIEFCNGSYRRHWVIDT